MVAEAEIMCQQTTLSVQYLRVDSAAKAATTTNITTVTAMANSSIVMTEPTRSESALSCSTSSLKVAAFDKFVPSIRSGSHTDIGPRRSNEDQHIRIDDLSSHLGSLYRWSQPSSFYAVFDGHGGMDAAAYVKDNAMRFFFEDAELPQTPDVDEKFLLDLESSHRRAFLLADQALADEQSSVDSYCGTTAITALVLGRHLLIANAGDSRAVLCRKGVAVQLSQDHRPTCQGERKRVEDLGGIIEYGYLNGDLSVTRALGDWYMKLPSGSASPLTAEPEIHQTLLMDEDEFLIMGCDGIWDVMSNQEAVNIVRMEYRYHGDPEKCAKELVNQALIRDTCDNLTAIVVCLSSPKCQEPAGPQRPRFRFCISEEARNKLQRMLEGN